MRPPKPGVTSEPAVSLTRVERPRIDLLHDRARRRLDQYRRRRRAGEVRIQLQLSLDSLPLWNRLDANRDGRIVARELRLRIKEAFDEVVALGK